MLYSHYINLNRQIFMLNFFFFRFVWDISQQNKWGGGANILPFDSHQAKSCPPGLT